MEYHKNFEDYVEMIVNHPNYKGLYYDRNSDGKVNWVVTGKSEKGKKRQDWWDNKCRENGIPIQKGCYATIARLIHPTGFHVCQTCGMKTSIFYEYPTSRTIKKLSKILNVNIGVADYTIREIITKFCTSHSQLVNLANFFGLQPPTSRQELIDMIYSQIVPYESSFFSPGVMSNSPDRFDGFHSYGLCCRKKKDKGRDDKNMKTYTQDRRAYENWSDGNWNLANRIMGEFNKQEPMVCPNCKEIRKMTADHIGPISLGFCHSTLFTPLCDSCNSSKNNRLNKEDVDKLLKKESDGTQVISWHAKRIWDLLKSRIENDMDAKKASSIMLKCHQNVLYLLALIYRATGESFLIRYLHPDYANVDYRFENFDMKDFTKTKILSKQIDSANKRKNRERYVRISFEVLEEFAEKDNRKTKFILNEGSKDVKEIVEAIEQNRYDLADKLLRNTIKRIAFKHYNDEWVQSYEQDLDLG